MFATHFDCLRPKNENHFFNIHQKHLLRKNLPNCIFHRGVGFDIYPAILGQKIKNLDFPQKFCKLRKNPLRGNTVQSIVRASPYPCSRVGVSPRPKKAPVALAKAMI